jgi:serine/threonine protein kinase
MPVHAQEDVRLLFPLILCNLDCVKIKREEMRKGLALRVEKSPSFTEEIKILPSGLDEYADPHPGPLPFPVPSVVTSIGDQLGAGGEGVVYRVETERFGPCALKYSFVSSLSGSVRPRLLAEAKTMEAIGPHPNLVRLYDKGTVDTLGGSYDWILMELHQGDLTEWMDTVLRRPRALSAEKQALLGDKPEKFEKTTLLDGLSGLEHMHSKGYIHRDVKLANMGLVLKPSVRCVVADLGFARRIVRDDGTLIPEGERTFIPGGTLAYFSVRVEQNQHQYYGDDIQSLLFSFLAYTYLYHSDVFSDGLGRVLAKQEILDRPEQYGADLEEKQRQRQEQKKKAKVLTFVRRSLDICFQKESAPIANLLLQWYLDREGADSLRERILYSAKITSLVGRVRNTDFCMLFLAWAARVHQQTLGGFVRDLLSLYARSSTPVRITRVAWEVLVELSGASLRSYLFPFIRSHLARYLSDACYRGKPLPELTRLFTPDLIFLSPTSLVTAFRELDSFPLDAKLAIYDDTDVVIERGVGRHSPAFRASLATNTVDGSGFLISPEVYINSFGAERITALGVRSVHACVVFPGAADIPFSQLRRLEVNGSDWADAKTGQLPSGVIVVEKNGQVSAFPTRRLAPATDLTDATFTPDPVAPDAVVRFRVTDRVYLCLFNIVDVAIRIK